MRFINQNHNAKSTDVIKNSARNGIPQQERDALEKIEQKLGIRFESNPKTVLNIEQGHVTDLYISGVEMNKIPNEIECLNYLKKVMFRHTPLLELSPSFYRLGKLENAWLDENKLTNLSALIGDLVSLKYLVLSRNQLECLPDSIGSLRALIKLDVSRNCLETLPDSIGELTNLTHLDLIGNKLKTLPITTGNMVNLYDLRLMENQLDSLPDSLTGLQKLKYLYLRNNHFTSLPPSLGHNRSIWKLKISHNQLSSIPPTFHASGIRVLDLDYNQIEEIPPVVRQMQHLVKLKLRGNPLQALPPWILEIPQPFEVIVDEMWKETPVYKELLARRHATWEAIRSLDLHTYRIWKDKVHPDELPKGWPYPREELAKLPGWTSSTPE